jgi:N-acetylmuramoyl-L-alanine amidase
MRHRRSAIAPIIVLLMLLAAPASTSADSPVASLKVTGTPFHPTTGSVQRATRLVVELVRAAELTVRVRDHAGTVVRTLAKEVPHETGRYRFEWDGRTRLGVELVNGGYLFELEAGEGTEVHRSELPTTKASYAIYPANPGAIVVAIDPGHGAPDPGAYYSGYKEATFNLDISKQVQAMLRGARVEVVMVRDADLSVNVPRLDRTDDGRIDRGDELQARLDLVNARRPDLMAIVMNNAYGCHCGHGTETYTNSSRTWTPEALDLAELIQQEHMRLLEQYRSASWAPFDRGARIHDGFFQMRPYSSSVPRPSTMPTILVESLFMDQPNELAVLARPSVRRSLAEAYYNAIARYLNARRHGLRYEVVSAPAAVGAGQPMHVEIRVTNRGQATAEGQKLRLGYLRPPKPVNGGSMPEMPHDGSGQHGTQLARVPIPPLGRGQSAVVAFDVVAPADTGQWILNADAVLPNVTYISNHGVPMLQHPLTVDATESPPVPVAPTPADPEPRVEIRPDPRITRQDLLPKEALFPIHDR